MKPTLEQLTEQFARLVAERVSVSPESLTASATTPAPLVVPSSGGAVSTHPPVAERVSVSSGSLTASATQPAAIQPTNHALKGYDLDVTVAPEQVVAAAELLDRAGFGLDAITGVDWLAQNQMEVVYDYFHPTEPLRIVVRARVPRGEPELPTISNVFPGANWHEREARDFFGLRFAGHPNLTPFLLPEDANFHPLRKDYTP